MAEKNIAYLGIAGFGATVARRADSRLADYPLVLLDEQRRVLDADSWAAQSGIQPGMTERQAAARCPEARIYPGSRFPVWEAQDALWTALRRFAGRWQPAGLGSAYLDATGTGSDLLGWCQALAGLARGLGWEPALGATGSKFGAWVAGQAAGENAALGRPLALLLAPDQQRAFLARQPVGMLPLDADAVVHLRHLGIRTLGQFTRLPAAGIRTRFGAAGLTAQRWAQGLDDRPVVPPEEAPEVSSRLEFESPLADRQRLLPALARRAERLLAPLRGQLQATSQLALTVTRADGRVVPARHTFPTPTAAAETVRLALDATLDRVPWDGQGATEITLTLAGITDAPCRQLTLFDFDHSNRSRLVSLLDRMAARYGAGSFRLAVPGNGANFLPEERFGWRSFG